jgi:hypothetical protein
VTDRAAGLGVIGGTDDLSKLKKLQYQINLISILISNVNYVS